MISCGSGPLSRSPRPPFGGIFRASAQTASRFAVPGVSEPRVRHRSESVDVDHGQIVGRRLEECPIVMDLHDLAPVGGRAASGRHRRRLERFATSQSQRSSARASADVDDMATFAPLTEIAAGLGPVRYSLAGADVEVDAEGTAPPPGLRQSRRLDDHHAEAAGASAAGVGAE